MVKLFFPGQHSVPATMQILNPDGHFILRHWGSLSFGILWLLNRLPARSKCPPRLSPLGVGVASILLTPGEFAMALQRLPGGGNGKPLQCSCLGNVMDRGAWRATVCGAARVGHNWVTERMQRLRNGEAALREAGGAENESEREIHSVESDSLRPHGILQVGGRGWLSRAVWVDWCPLSTMATWGYDHIHTVTALSALWGDPSPWALTLEKNLSITCKVEKFYLSLWCLVIKSCLTLWAHGL